MTKDDKNKVKTPVKKVVKNVSDSDDEEVDEEVDEVKVDVKVDVKVIKNPVKKPVKKVVKKVSDSDDDVEVKVDDDKVIKNPVKKPVKKVVKKVIKKVSDSEDDSEDVNEEDGIIYLKPILKWVGGKTQIIDEIIESFPDKMDNYHELFTGGGSVLIALLQNVNEKKISIKNKIYAYDINETLINIYKNIQKKPDEVIKNIKKLINEYNSILNIKKDTKKDTKKRKTIKTPTNIEEAKISQELYYYWIRSVFNKMKQEEKNNPTGSAHFIFLNKTCFRGVYREGPNGFNVPFGNYNSPEIINEEHVKKISELIKNVEFIKSDFKVSFDNIKKHDFIYADPPYVPENATSFVGYTIGGFNLEKHEKLFELCKKHNFVMSNSDTDLVKNSFADTKKYSIDIVSCKRSINSKKPGSKTNEVIIKSL